MCIYTTSLELISSGMRIDCHAYGVALNPPHISTSAKSGSKTKEFSLHFFNHAPKKNSVLPSC